MLDTKEHKCTSCGASYKKGQNFCKYCGTKLDKYCGQCGTSISSGATYCTKCGAPVSRFPFKDLATLFRSGGRVPSFLPLLIVILVVVIAGIGGLIYWQLGQDRTMYATIKIWDIKVTHIGETSATIEWKTDVPASSQVEYGRTKQYGSLTPLEPKNDPTTKNSTGVTSHSILILNLNAGTTYNYRVRSKDVSGKEVVSDIGGTFKTKTRDERFRWDF